MAPPGRVEASMLAGWDGDSAAARLLEGSVAWQRARAWRAEVERERDAVVDTLGLDKKIWTQERASAGI